MKKYVFGFSWGFGDHNNEEEIFEFEDNVTEEEVGKAYEDWLLGFVVEDRIYWYEKEGDE
ncbi:MAG: hypothetical protein ACOCZ5_03515 [bacterium]